MKIRILFESKDACKEEYEQGISSGKAYQEQQDTLTNWKKTHKMMRYVIFLLRVAVVVGLIWLFFFYDISREVHFYMNDADTMVRSIIMDISTFFVSADLYGEIVRVLIQACHSEQRSAAGTVAVSRAEEPCA